jgi:integrase
VSVIGSIFPALPPASAPLPGGSMSAMAGMAVRVEVRRRPFSRWTQKYGQDHQLVRIQDWPPGISPPNKVRIYFRAGHFVLQWWDPTAKRNLSDRVDGDLVDAIARARDIDQRLLDYKTSGHAGRRLKHPDLVDKFLKDLAGRADAGQIEPRTVNRYTSALAHYLAFIRSAATAAKFPFVISVNREFALAFAAFLRQRQVGPNGSAHATRHLMRHTSSAFVWDAVRVMLAWAADPDRGALLPPGFRNPFLRRAGDRNRVVQDPFGQPDISIDMARQFMEACDDYQLRLFTPLIFFGLRAAEPCYLFAEYIEDGWLRVPCNPELGYSTKGKRDKRLPLIGPLTTVLALRPQQQGLLYVRRNLVNASTAAPLLGASLNRIIQELKSRFDGQVATPVMRHQLRDQILKEAGGITYDQIEGEFRSIAGKLRWPASATLKDFRHLFATSLANAGMPEPYRQYLMGHATSSAVIGTYTHLNKLREHYEQAVEKEWPGLVEVLVRRVTTTPGSGGQR